MDHPSITRERGEAILREDLKGSRDAVVALSPNVLLEPEQRTAALIDFVFNLGAGRYRGSTLRKRVAEGDWEQAGKEMRRWVYASGRVFPALVRRRDTAARWIEANA
jgi:lysozyme